MRYATNWMEAVIEGVHRRIKLMAVAPEEAVMATNWQEA